MKVILTQKEIQLKVEQMADSITFACADVILCTLSGAFMFFNDLVRQANHTIQIDFIKASSYNEQGHRLPSTIVSGPLGRTDLIGKNIIVIEDIIDSGVTIQQIVTKLQRSFPASITIVSLLKRKSQATDAILAELMTSNKVHIEYGFEVDDGWLVGYGLDDNGKDRTLPYIYKKQ